MNILFSRSRLLLGSGESWRKFARFDRLFGNGVGLSACQATDKRRFALTDQVNNVPVLSEKTVYPFLNKYDNFLLDCDGVLWGTDHFTRFGNISKTINKLRSLDKNLLFITNNSLPSREDYLSKFINIAGFESSKDDVFSVGYAAAVYLKHIARIEGKCYLIGSVGMKQELDDMNIDNIGHGQDLEKPSEIPEKLLKQMSVSEDVEAVLVGFDIDFNYNKLYKAASYLLDEKCHYLATSELECSIALGPRQCQPLVGSLTSAVTSAAKRPPVVIGKPHRFLLDCIQHTRPGIDLRRSIMIGDSLKTDVAFARNVGLDSALVLTGATSLQDLQSVDAKDLSKPLPDYILPSLSLLGEFI